MVYTEIESPEKLRELLNSANVVEYHVFQNFDLSKEESKILKIKFKSCLFLGCRLNQTILCHLWTENDIFPSMNFPYQQYPSALYRADVLYNNYTVGKPESYKQCYDYKVYNHFIEHPEESTSVKETLARRLHDHAITDALYDFLINYDEKSVIAIMGGHNLSRQSDEFKKIALLSKKLCESGFIMVSGGGPGAMEATHFGAWFAGRDEAELIDALHLLNRAPGFQHPLWLDTAMEVIERYPQLFGFESLGIPTWLYGHEPSTPFATKIAKYFANSVREDGLLTIAKGGLIFTPGSAGTLQEVFQDATQNHYELFGYASPMVFYGENFWTNMVPVFPFIQDLLKKGIYKNLIIDLIEDDEKLLSLFEKFRKMQ